MTGAPPKDTRLRQAWYDAGNRPYSLKFGNVQVPIGSRNGNLQITQFYYGAAQPSDVAAQASGLFLGNAQDNSQDCAKKGRSNFQTRPNRGSSVPSAKLNEWSACGVMARCLMGISRSEAAREFGIHHSTAQNIWSGERWKHVFAEDAK